MHEPVRGGIRLELRNALERLAGREIAPNRRMLTASESILLTIRLYASVNLTSLSQETVGLKLKNSLLDVHFREQHTVDLRAVLQLPDEMVHHLMTVVLTGTMPADIREGYRRQLTVLEPIGRHESSAACVREAMLVEALRTTIG